MLRAVELTFETGRIVCDAPFVAFAGAADTLVVTADGKLLKLSTGHILRSRLAHPLADAGNLIPSTSPEPGMYCNPYCNQASTG